LAKQSSPYKRVRTFFLAVFFVSFCATIISVYLTPQPITAAVYLIQAAPGISTHPPHPLATMTSSGTQNPAETSIPTLIKAPTETSTAYPEMLPGSSQPTEMTIFIFGTGLTSFISFLGFVSTTILGWRKESREAKVAELERSEIEIRLEKERLELEKLPGAKPKDIARSRAITKKHGSEAHQKKFVTSARLTGMNGSVAGQVYSLMDGWVIGRSIQSSLRLSDPAVSRQHARFRFGGDRWFIQDMNSTGGIYVNGKQVDAVALTNGDHILIGSTEFVFYDG